MAGLDPVINTIPNIMTRLDSAIHTILNVITGLDPPAGHSLRRGDGPAIHLAACTMDARIKSGHDEFVWIIDQTRPAPGIEALALTFGVRHHKRDLRIAAMRASP